jgi:hypothetical protein
MYYAEKWIDGILHIKGSPDEPWRRAPAVILNARLREVTGLLEAEREKQLDDHLATARAMNEERRRLFFRTLDAVLEIAP